MKRIAAVAGHFYPKHKERLRDLIKNSFLSEYGPKKMPGEVKKIQGKTPFLVVPHAGYIYSGPIAAMSYLELSKYDEPDTIIVIGPNHRGYGPIIAVPKNVTQWETPFGDVSINHEITDQLVADNHIIEKNDESHEKEHSVEVQLPFLQYILKNNFDFVPIVITRQNYEHAKSLGETLAKVLKDKNAIVIASSDFTHYEPHEQAKQKDEKVLQAIEQMSGKKMYEIKDQLKVTMCGYGPILATMIAAEKSGRNQVKILGYSTSGEVSGNKSQVVGYASISFY